VSLPRRVRHVPRRLVAGLVVLVLAALAVTITALATTSPAIPTHFQYSWLDALGPNIGWDITS
jgi:hypothetical protein